MGTRGGGGVAVGRDPKTGENIYPNLELVRLTIPKRVYTQANMDVVAESVSAVHLQRDSISGLRFTYEPELLRFFQARFESVIGKRVPPRSPKTALSCSPQKSDTN